MTSGAEVDIGLVVSGHGRHYVVETPEGRRLICHPRGKKSECVVGDRVRWVPTGDAEGVIEHVKAENAKGTHDPFMNTLTEAARKDPKWAMHTVVLVIVAAALIAGGIFALVAFG